MCSSKCMRVRGPAQRTTTCWASLSCLAFLQPPGVCLRSMSSLTLMPMASSMCLLRTRQLVSAALDFCMYCTHVSRRNTFQYACWHTPACLHHISQLQASFKLPSGRYSQLVISHHTGRVSAPYMFSNALGPYVDRGLLSAHHRNNLH